MIILKVIHRRTFHLSFLSLVDTPFMFNFSRAPNNKIEKIDGGKLLDQHLADFLFFPTDPLAMTFAI